MADKILQGSVLVFVLYDVAEEINLEEMRTILGGQKVEHTFKHAAPEYLGFQRPPVVEQLEPVVLAGGERLKASINYYDYGVVSVSFELPFAGGWDALLQLSSRWIWETDFEARSRAIATERLKCAALALVKPYENWLSEDYFIFHLRKIPGHPSARQLLTEHAQQITEIVRGETNQLSDDEQREILQSSISYYPNDLVVIGWTSALIVDEPAGAATAIQLLEYANSQLLEFRHYDQFLTRELEKVYRSLDRGTGLLDRWRLARDARRLYTVALDVTEIAERADTAIKFLSDMFSARLYRLAANKVGVPDYRRLVENKLRIAEALYRFMVEQFQQGRAFALELLVVLILLIELFYFFKGSR